MLSDLPPHVQREVQRIADGAARRLLREAREAGADIQSLTVNIAEDWDTLTLEEQRALIRATIERAVVMPARPRGKRPDTESGDEGTGRPQA